MIDHVKRRISTSLQAVHDAAFEVHRITNRTDQSIGDLIRLYPNHEAVKKYNEVLKVYYQEVNDEKS